MLAVKLGARPSHGHESACIVARERDRVEGNAMFDERCKLKQVRRACVIPRRERTRVQRATRRHAFYQAALQGFFEKLEQRRLDALMVPLDMDGRWQVATLGSSS
jgi:hypothetical protein